MTGGWCELHQAAADPVTVVESDGRRVAVCDDCRALVEEADELWREIKDRQGKT